MELAASLTRLRDFLGRHGEGAWAGALARALAAHAGDEAALARAVQGLCPGLARLVLSPANGHGVQVCAIDGTNRKLAALRGALCAAAAEMG
jgi:hypothetical protein